jgi:hypothetical protein
VGVREAVWTVGLVTAIPRMFVRMGMQLAAGPSSRMRVFVETPGWAVIFGGLVLRGDGLPALADHLVSWRLSGGSRVACAE